MTNQRDALLKAKERYEQLQQYCLRAGNKHPDSKEPCQFAIGAYRMRIDPLGFNALCLADDMALAITAALAAPELQPTQSDEDAAHHITQSFYQIDYDSPFEGWPEDEIEEILHTKKEIIYKLIKAFAAIREDERKKYVKE